MTRVSKSLNMLVLVSVAVASAAAGAPTGKPVLTSAQVEAAVLEGFPSIEAAAAAVDAAEARLKQVRRLPDPTLDLGGGRGEDRYGPASDSEWRIGLEMELPAPWKYGKATTAAEAMISVAAADLVSTRARTVARIRALLLRLSAAQRRVEVLESQVEMVRSLAQFTALKVELGEARELERLRMEVELGRIRRGADLARAERDALASTLVRLSKERLPAHFTLELPLNGTPPAIDAGALAGAVMETNPELAAQLQRARAAEARTAFQRSMSLPTFVTRVDWATEYDSRSASLAVALKVPLWNRNRPAVAAADAEHRMALARVEERRRNLLSRLDAAAARYEAARKTALRFTGTILPAAREATRLAELSYREGETSILDLLDARRNAQDAELEDLQARLELHLLRVEIDLLTGRLQPAAPPSTPDSTTSKENAS
ncbi:MAG: TolC family protein [Acidobacteria bacterium]|nr:TolC family protein [Acidobacteriota bacterium]